MGKLFLYNMLLENTHQFLEFNLVDSNIIEIISNEKLILLDQL